jgi:transposase
MSDDKDKKPVAVQEEPGFDWTQWAEPLTEDEVKELPTQKELAAAAKRGYRDS